jgi:DNA transformation protein
VGELAGLPNLGAVTERRLAAVGIRTRADLQRVGAVEAWLRLRDAFPGQTSRNALYALEGALLGERWDRLPDEVLRRLRRAADAAG